MQKRLLALVLLKAISLDKIIACKGYI
jgi:hypothetical protein